MIALGNACSRRWYPQAAAKNEGGAPSSDASERPVPRQDNPRLALVQSATAQFATSGRPDSVVVAQHAAPVEPFGAVRSLQRHRICGVILRLPDEGSRSSIRTPVGKDLN